MKAKIALLVLMFSTALMSFGQATVKVTGKVTDDNGEGLIGVSITAKGANQGVTTDIDGNYQIETTTGTTLVYSYVGYDAAERRVEKAGVIDVTLHESTTELSDVVVVGYGVQKKSSVTGAISQIKPEDIQNRTIVNPQSALMGKTAGVQVVTTSNAPGSSPTIRVRGYSSNVSSDPLYVVDGVRLSDISGIDPNDIASMEVLKDAASAAIYGAEAGNGVVLITTKRGSAGNGKISYDFQYAWERPAKVPKMLNAEQYIQYMSEGNTFTEDYLLKNWDGVTNTSWIDEAFETGHMQRHNISFTNGNERGNYYLSLSYLHNNGIVGGGKDKYERLTAAINAEYDIKTWLKVGTTNQIEKYNVSQVSSNNEYGSLITSTLLLDPLTPFVYAPDKLPLHMINAQQQGRHLLTDENGNYYAVSKFLNSENYHPYVMRDNGVSRNGGFNVTGSIFADFKPFAGFTFTSRLGYRLTSGHQSNVNLPFYGNATQSGDYVGMNAQNSQSVYWQWENFANYFKQFGVNTISAMVGMSYQETVSSYTQGSLTGQNEDALKKNDPLFWYLNYGNASATKGVGGEKTRNSKMSYFGRVSYEYDNRYHLQASLRADAADLSKLPLENRWGYFPAVSAGWTISNESFFEDARRFADNVKLRASWGQNGSLAALGGYPYSTDMALGGIYPLVPGNIYTTSAAPSTMGNNKLKWETSEQFDIGLDMRFLRNRLGFSVDWYTKKTKDLLVNGTIPSLIVGGTTSPMNAGNVSNKGWEVELSWRDAVGDFRYSATFNLSTLTNKVTYLDPSINRIAGTNFHTSTITYFEKDYPVYYFRGYQFDGLDGQGNPKFKDLDGSGDLNDGDIAYIGDAIPDVTYGITLNVGWKGLDLTVFGTGAAGNKVFNCINRADFPQCNKLKEVFFDNRWTADNPGGTVPKAGAANMDKYQISDALVYDGSFFKIKQIQLGYMLPQKWVNKLYVSNLRVYASLDDFFCFTKYPGFDPEVAVNATSGMGIDKGSYPSAKKVVLGFNITF